MDLKQYIKSSFVQHIQLFVPGFLFTTKTMMLTERENHKPGTGSAAEWESCSVTTRRVVGRNQITRRWDCQEYKMASGQILSVKRADPVRVKSSFY